MMMRKIARMLARTHTCLTTGGLLFGIFLTSFTSVLVPPVAAAEFMGQPDLSEDLLILGDINEIDNPNQID